MSRFENDALTLVRRIQDLVTGFEQQSQVHQQNESFVAVDTEPFTLTVKVMSPFGNGETSEAMRSTNELQQRINYWLGVQRQLGMLASIRVVVTPVLIEDGES